jgi:hypothetical protein
MNPALRVTVPVVILAAAAAVLFSSWRSRGESFEARNERAQLKREFLERASLSRQIPAERSKDWREEVRALLRWYFDEAAASRNRHPGATRETEPVRPGKAKGDEATRAAWQRYAEERLAMLRDGKYEPRWSLADRGLRLDILAIEPEKNPAGGGRALRIDFALWGAPRRVEKDTVAGTTRTTTKVVVPVTFRQIAFQFLDDKDKPYGEMSGPGEPYMKLADPERFFEEFPPGILFGTWYVDAFPRQAAKVVFTVVLDGRGQSGADIPASYKLELPVAETWKIAEGETYQAETREAQ